MSASSLFASPWPFPFFGISHTWYSRYCGGTGACLADPFPAMPGIRISMAAMRPVGGWFSFEVAIWKCLGDSLVGRGHFWGQVCGTRRLFGCSGDSFSIARQESGKHQGRPAFRRSCGVRQCRVAFVWNQWTVGRVSSNVHNPLNIEITWNPESIFDIIEWHLMIRQVKIW